MAILATLLSCTFGRALELDVLLDVKEVVKRALERPALEDAIAGGIGKAQADSLGERLWANPELSYSRERTDGPEGTLEDYFWVTERFDLSGRLRFLSRAADQRAAALRQDGLARHARIRAQASLSFYDVLRHQRLVESARTLVDRLETAADSVVRRERAGDASAYDRRRIERELSIARMRLLTLDARRHRAWAQLAALIGDQRAPDSPWPRVSGVLLPKELDEKDHLFERISRRPEFRAMQNEEAAAELTLKAASRWWIPSFDLGAGYKRVDLGDAVTDGYLAMATVILPLFDHDQANAMRAKADVRRIRAERRLAIDELHAEVHGLVREAESLRAAALRFRSEREKEAVLLVRSAEAGYRGGELGVLEVLDAYRGAQEDEERVIDLEFQARRARIEVEYSTGAYAHRAEEASAP